MKVLVGIDMITVSLTVVAVLRSVNAWNSIDDKLCADKPVFGSFQCPDGSGTFKMKNAWSWSKFECDIKYTESIYSRMESKCDLGTCAYGDEYIDPDRWWREENMDCSVPQWSEFVELRDVFAEKMDEGIENLGKYSDAAQWVIDTLIDLVDGDLEDILYNEDDYNTAVAGDGSFSEFFSDICVLHDICYRGTDRDQEECDDDFYANLIHHCSYALTSNQNTYDLPDFHGSALTNLISATGLPFCYSWAVIFQAMVRTTEEKRATGLSRYYQYCDPDAAPTSNTSSAGVAYYHRKWRKDQMFAEVAASMEDALKKVGVIPDDSAKLEWRINVLTVVVMVLLAMLCFIQCRGVYLQRQKHQYVPIKLSSDLETDTES